jgi:hypothetical protein
MAPLPAAPPRRPPLIVRVFTSPVTAGAVERRLQRSLRPLVRRVLIAAPLVFLAMLVVSGVMLWRLRPVALTPQYRAEALCFALAERPRFAPPMAVEAGSAHVAQPFPPGTPPSVAMRGVMHFDDPQVAQEWERHIGDYDVDVVWLRVAEHGDSRYWLVAGWLEGDVLETCSFRFAGSEPLPTDEQRLWGQRLLMRVLRSEYFTAGVLPRVRLRVVSGETPLRFGPPEAD